MERDIWVDSLLVLSCMIILGANIVVGRTESPKKFTGESRTVLESSKLDLQLDVAQWNRAGMTIPRQLFILPRCGACSNTPTTRWSHLLSSFEGEIIAPNYLSDLQPSIRTWASNRGVKSDPEARLLPPELWDSGPIMLTINKKGLITSGDSGWPK